MSNDEEIIEELFGRALEYKSRQEHDRAIECLMIIIRADGSQTEAYYGLADCQCSKGDLDAAIKNYSLVLGREPEHVGALTGRGSVYVKQLDFKRALRDFKAAVKLDPFNADVWRGCGMCYLMRNDPYKGIVAYTRSIDLAAKAGRADAMSYLGRADCHLRYAEWEMAVLDLSEAIRLEPGLPHAYELRRQCYEHMGRRDAARADLHHLQSMLGYN